MSNKLLHDTQSNAGLVSPLEIRVARQIARLRAEKGLSQAALAAKCGLSAAYLSRVESNSSALTLASLEKVAAALGVDITALVADETGNAPLSLHRKGRGKIGHLRGKGSHAYMLLAAEKRGKLMEPLIVTVKSGKAAGRLQGHGGEEFDYLLEGRCTFYYGKDSFVLEAGDAVYYDATIPHGIRSDPGIVSRLLVVVSSRDYLFHGDIEKLLATSAR
jgi:transcriptional regulator with XRE-family HTH domain